MRSLLLILLLAALPLMGVLSCQKVNHEPDTSGLVALEGIPLAYGQLKAVTTAQQYPGWAQLWFQDDAGTIRMVRVKWLSNQQLDKILTIPRS